MVEVTQGFIAMLATKKAYSVEIFSLEGRPFFVKAVIIEQTKVVGLTEAKAIQLSLKITKARALFVVSFAFFSSFFNLIATIKIDLYLVSSHLLQLVVTIAEKNPSVQSKQYFKLTYFTATTFIAIEIFVTEFTVMIAITLYSSGILVLFSVILVLFSFFPLPTMKTL